MQGPPPSLDQPLEKEKLKPVGHVPKTGTLMTSAGAYVPKEVKNFAAGAQSSVPSSQGTSNDPQRPSNEPIKDHKNEGEKVSNEGGSQQPNETPMMPPKLMPQAKPVTEDIPFDLIIESDLSLRRRLESLREKEK